MNKIFNDLNVFLHVRMQHSPEIQCPRKSLQQRILRARINYDNTRYIGNTGCPNDLNSDYQADPNLSSIFELLFKVIAVLQKY